MELKGSCNKRHNERGWDEMRYISRNQAAVLIGHAIYGTPRAISLATLLELIRQGHIRQVSVPSLGGKLMRHQIDAESVDSYIAKMKEGGHGVGIGPAGPDTKQAIGAAR